MRDQLRAITASDAKEPLTPVEVVPDYILHKLAAGDAARQRGEISEEDTAILTMILPDLCGELLAYRLAARAGAR